MSQCQNDKCAPNGEGLLPANTIRADGPPRMVKRPNGSGGEPSSPNCGASAGGKDRHSPQLNSLHDNGLAAVETRFCSVCVTFRYFSGVTFGNPTRTNRGKTSRTVSTWRHVP